VLKQRIIKERTHNKHIGEIAAVTPLERKWKFGSYYPAGSSVEAATSPICRTLSASGGHVQQDNDSETRNNETLT